MWYYVVMVKRVSKSIRKNTRSFSVVYEAAPEGGYVAFIPSLPGCHTQADTLEEAEKNIQEAAQAYLESCMQERRNIPRESRVLQGRIEVRA
jgi:antitoxin HicB